ncbi:MAG: phosphatidate cytidylyltransferase [Bacteroidota bacterium]
MQETTETSSEIPYRAELLRKSLHLLALVIPASMLYLGKTTSLLILVPFCGLAIFTEAARVRFQTVADIVEMIFGRMMRNHERPKIGDAVVINGATWVLLTATLLVVIFPVDVAAISMIMFMIGDAAAALVGRRFGKIRWLNSTKTVEGSLSFFIVAAGILMLFDLLPLPYSMGIAAFATLLELLPLRLNDNLYVPLLTAGMMYCLMRFLLLQDVTLFF